MVAIVDYGLGNLGSIRNMLKKIGTDDVTLASSSEDIQRADKLILPGVGAFDSGMRMLNESGMRDDLDNHVKKLQKPVLGICLGMQMLGTGSEEGEEKGLGYIDFYCKRFSFDNNGLRIPHMGWDYVDAKRESAISSVDEKELRFYFVHSYYAVCKDETDILFTCDYGITFTAGVKHNNVYGVQFHPEKSHKYGMKLLKQFVEEA